MASKRIDERDLTKSEKEWNVADLVDNTGWWTMPVTYISSGSGGLPSNNQRCTFLLINKN